MINPALESQAGKITPADISAVTTPAILDRFESKYIIHHSLIDSIVRFITPYCSYDKYSALSPDKFYKINSLYFDTPDFLFLRQRLLKTEKRFNMRIRSYGDSPSMPYFFEIKQRIGDVVRKTRARVDDPGFARYFLSSSEPPPEDGDKKNTKNRNLFYQTFHKYNARPVVMVQYRRQAFFSNYEEYARVTFDIGLRYMSRDNYHDYNPVPFEPAMIPCDVQTGPEDAGFVILELKCYTSFVPLWMIDMVRTFNLKRIGFSKYSTCLKPVLSRNTLNELITRNPSRLNHDFFTEEI